MNRVFVRFVFFAYILHVCVSWLLHADKLHAWHYILVPPHPHTLWTKDFWSCCMNNIFVLREYTDTTTKHIQFIGLHTILHTQTTSWKNHFSFLLLRLLLLPMCTKINSPLTNVTVMVVSCSWTSKSVQHDFLEAEYFILHSKDTNNVRSCDILFKNWLTKVKFPSAEPWKFVFLFKKRRRKRYPARHPIHR